MNGSRLFSLFRQVRPFSFQKFIRFSSSSSSWDAATETSGFSNLFSNRSGNEGSSVYQYKLQTQRPTTIKRRTRLQIYDFEEKKKRLENSVSLIGSVAFPLKTVKYSNYGVYTMLEVRTSKDSDRTFRILLKMWGDMAKIAFRHLKEEDYIHVSGRLGTYEKVDPSGNKRTFHEVIVKELNFVACNFESQTIKSNKSEDSEESEPKEEAVVPMSYEEKAAENLYLWQVFFANPFEWWDNRQGKKNPRQPDFKHKDTGEVLWLDSKAPPWVRKQLKLHDSRIAEQGLRGLVNSSRSRVSVWTLED